MSKQWEIHKKNFEYRESLDDTFLPWFGHTFFAYDLIRNFKPQVLVELGTYKGSSFFSFAQAVKDADLNTELNAIDSWEGDKHSKTEDHESFNKLYKDFQKNLKKYYDGLNTKVHKMFFEDAVKKFDDKSVDLLHIDGLHTYKAVKNDFKTWLPKMKNDGIILFHDIAEKTKDFGVYKLWKELKKEYSTLEFDHSHGLGVLFLSNKKASEFNIPNNIISEVYSLKDEKAKLERKYSNLKSKLDQKNLEYHRVINSRIWKLRNQVFKYLDTQRVID